MIIGNAIKSLAPDSEFIIENDDYSTIKWIISPKIIPTESEVNTELIRLQAEYDSQEYARNRASATGYPSIPDQLDEIYHNGIDSWKAVIKVTKDKYPKG